MLDLVGISEKDEGTIETILSKFLLDYANITSFSEVSETEKKAAWAGLFEIVERNLSHQVQEKALMCCRILSRDKTGINELIENKNVDLLLVRSGISGPADTAHGVRFEAKKVLSNLIHQSTTVQAYCTTNGFLQNIFKTIENNKGREEVDRFDLRLIFLLTALCPEQRQLCNSQFSSLTVLNKVLRSCCGTKPCTLSLALYIGEVLKVLFNLTLETKDEDTQELKEISGTLNSLLDQEYEDEDAKTTVVSNVINFLTNLDGKPDVTGELFFQHETKHVETILNFLLGKLEKVLGSNPLCLKEELSPAISVLWSLSKMHPAVRKYLKAIVLPPLTAQDIQTKPEKGSSARSRLVSLLTNPDPEIATMTAEFLFVLCKHNVGKLVKHSGYGNAAGLLARRGLLQGGRGEGNFSSDEESDTEDYQRQAHKINPITGCVEEKRRNPLEGMSEEQKEYEAMKLMNMMDQLTRGGFIQPAKIGEDGKPEPVEHILQLTEGLKTEDKSGEESETD